MADCDAAWLCERARVERELVLLAGPVDSEDRAVGARADGRQEAVVIDLEDPERAVLVEGEVHDVREAAREHRRRRRSSGSTR